MLSNFLQLQSGILFFLQRKILGKTAEDWFAEKPIFSATHHPNCVLYYMLWWESKVVLITGYLPWNEPLIAFKLNGSSSNQFDFDFENLNRQIELDKKFVETCNKNIAKFDSYTPTLFFTINR